MNQHHVNVSVIVPIYNADEYVRETIESLLSQTLTGIEIILIDDCSTDDSYNIAAHYAALDPRIVLHRQDRNQGVSIARNTALDMVKGEYIFFIDADDKISPDTLEAMYTAAIEKGADLVTGIYERFDSKNQTTIMPFFEQFPELKREGYKNVYEFPEMFYSIYCWGKLFHKSLIETIKFDPHISFAEDHLFTIQSMLKAQKIYNIENVIYFYRLRDQTTQSATQSIYKDPIKNLKNLIRVLNSAEQYFEYFTLDKEQKLRIFGKYLQRVLHWNVWTALSNGLLSLNISTRPDLIALYQQYLLTLNVDQKAYNYSDFKTIDARLMKLEVVLDVNTIKSIQRLLRTN